MNFCIFVLVSMLPLWPHAVASGLRSKQVPYTGSTDPDYPVWNIHIAEPLDTLELERMSSSLQSYSRQLVALEEAHVTNSDFAASTMTSTVAQIQALVDIAEKLAAQAMNGR